MRKRGRLTHEEKEFIETCVKKNVGSAFFFSISQRVAEMVSNEAKYVARIEELEKDKAKTQTNIRALIDDHILDTCSQCGSFDDSETIFMCNVCHEGRFCEDCEVEGNAVYDCDVCDFRACICCLFRREQYDRLCSHLQVKCHSKDCATLITKDLDSYECKLHGECPFLVCKDCHEYSK
jgi:hypothetical protein